LWIVKNTAYTILKALNSIRTIFEDRPYFGFATYISTIILFTIILASFGASIFWYALFVGGITAIFAMAHAIPAYAGIFIGIFLIIIAIATFWRR